MFNILPISKEFKDIYNFYFKESNDSNINRKYWKNKIFKENPEILFFKESLNPLTRSIKFSSLYLPKSRYIDQKILISLIFQHLRILGLNETNKSLENETLFKINYPFHLKKSQLLTILQKGIFYTENFWNLICPSNNLSQKEIENILEKDFNSIIGTLPKFEILNYEDLYENPNSIIFDLNSNINYITLNQLIIILTSNSNLNNKILYKSFLFTFRLIISSIELFNRIKNRILLCFNNKDIENLILTINFLNDFIYYGNLEPITIDEIKLFIKNDLNKYYNKKIEIIKKEFKEYFIDFDTAPIVLLGNLQNKIWFEDFNLFELPIEELGRQITYRTSTKFYLIESNELVGCNWNHFKSKYLTPNIYLLNEQSNSLGNWVSYTILSGKTFEERINFIKFFLNLIKFLWNIKNIFYYYSILGGITHKSISRLNNHWEEISENDKNIIIKLEDFIKDPQYKIIKEYQLNKALKKPVIPFFLPILNDLIHQKEVETYYEKNFIVLSKLTRTYLHIKEFRSFFKKKFNFLPILQIQEKLNKCTELNGDFLYNISLEIESKKN